MVSCGRLEIGQMIFLVQDQADCQSAAGYQPAPRNQNSIVVTPDYWPRRSKVVVPSTRTLE
jgi:hypothetical protein